MGIEQRLENLFGLREEQRDLKDGTSPEANKKINQINKKAESLLSNETKIGQIRQGELMEEAQKENAFREGIKKLAEESHLQIDWQKFSAQMENDRRYVALNAVIASAGGRVDAFFKALKPNFRREESGRDQAAFVREMETMVFLKERTDLPALKIYANNIDAFEPLYNLTATLPEAEIGFIHSRADTEKLKPEHAKQAVDQLFVLNAVNLPEDIDERIHDLQDPFEHYEGYQENLWNLLDNKEEPDCTEVRPLDGKRDREGNIKPEVYIDVLARRFGMGGKEMRQKVGALLERWRPVAEKYDGGGWVMTHGDLSPNNMYVGGDNKTILLDWEWAGKTRNKLMALVYDYGNLRARAWNNPEYQAALDQEIKDRFAGLGDPEAGSAVVSLGTLRSHANLAGFFENYEPDKQLEPEETERRRLTEAAISRAFAEAGIEFGRFKQ